jgi:pimeloyl-ACP methyl ester carboxylesterase
MSEATILFVPGLACTGDVFAPQIATLSPRYECLVADHTKGDTIAQIAANILAQAPERFALLGFSLGGYIAFEMLRQAPSRVERLALLDTQAGPETEAAREKRLRLIALVEAGRFAEAEQAQWPDVVHPSRYGDTALREIKTRMAQELGPEQWLRHVRAIMARPDSRPTLASIGVPTLVLVGAEDQLTTPERAREMVAGIANARLVVIPKCGHMAPVERPEAVSAALEEWMTW